MPQESVKLALGRNTSMDKQPKMNLSIHNAYPPITPSALDAVEHRIGRPIPAAYRRFLLEHNGGWPEPGDFCITWADERQEQISVEWFLPVDTQDAIDLEATLKVYQDRIPETLFPVARAGGGGLVWPISKSNALRMSTHPPGHVVMAAWRQSRRKQGGFME